MSEIKYVRSMPLTRLFEKQRDMQVGSESYSAYFKIIVKYERKPLQMF